MAQGISMIAIPWYFVKNDSMETFGWFYVMTNVIALLWVPYCGTLIDRYSRKKLLWIMMLACGIVLASISGFGFYNNGLPMYLVGAVFMMTFFNYSLHYPALYALVQEISEKKWYGKLASYIEIQGQLAAVLAGAGAAILLEGTKNGHINLFGFQTNIGTDILPWQIHEIFLLDTCTYFLGFFFILLMKFIPIAQRTPEGGNIAEQLQVGWNYLKNNKALFLFGVASYTVFVAVLVTTFYLAAAYVKEHLELNGDVFAASEMYYAVGAIFAGVTIRQIFKKVSITFSIILMTLITCGLYMVLALTASEFIFYGMMVILGLCNAGTRIQRITFLFSNIPNQVLGRANSIFVLSNLILRISLMSIFALSFFHTNHNITYAFVIVSILLLTSALLLIRYSNDIGNIKSV